MVTHILYRPHNNDSVSRISDTEVDVPLANFRESRICELRLVLTPMGENFSGSCIVTIRNPLIQKGATTATNSERFGAGGLQ